MATRYTAILKRDDMKRFERKARQRLLSFLLRHGHQYSGKKNWTKGFYTWLATVRFSHSAQQVTLQEYIDMTNDCRERIQRITQQIQVHVEEWNRAPFVKAYQALRGVSIIVATTVVAEIGDMKRFQSPKQLMAYLGLIPSEHSSGKTVRRGPITKTGNSHIRRVLIEAAWTYKMQARVSKCRREYRTYFLSDKRDYPRVFVIFPGKHRPDFARGIGGYMQEENPDKPW